MKQVVIENPVINSPFDEPNRHFKFTDEGITDKTVEGRRTSSYFVPIAQPKKKGSKQLPSRPNGLRTGSKKTSSSTTSDAVWRCGARAGSSVSLRRRHG
jgi:type III restriction enzyme